LDPTYAPTKRFHENPQQLADAFATLVQTDARDMGPVSRYRPARSFETLLWQDPVPAGIMN
jgi:catalase-peroxidase